MHAAILQCTSASFLVIMFSETGGKVFGTLIKYYLEHKTFSATMVIGICVTEAETPT